MKPGERLLGGGFIWGVILICGLILLPNTSAVDICSLPEASPPNDDKFFQLNAQSTTFKPDGCRVGLDITNGYYRDYTQSIPVYHKYFKTVCTPWIILGWDTHGEQYYEFSEDNMDGFLEYQGGGGVTQEADAGDGSESSIIEYDYDLDVDSDGRPEFQFALLDIFLGKGGYDDNGFVISVVHVANSPKDLGLDFCHIWPDDSVDYVSYMYVCWRIDSDVWSTSQNIVQTFDGSSWCTANIEESHDDCPANYDQNGNRQVKIRNENEGKQTSICMSPYDVHVGGKFFILQRHSDEYWQWPNTYDNNEDVSNQDVLVTYCLRYSAWDENGAWPSVNGNPPAQILLCNFV